MSEHKYLTIKEWAEDDRPREKLLTKGISSLSDAELIAIIIGSGSKNESAVELSKRILASVNNNLNHLGKLSIDELMRYKGIGEAKAISIVATMELGRRRKLAEAIEQPKFICSKDVFAFFSPIISDLPYEEFWILLLNRANTYIDHVKLSSGGINGTVVDVRLIIKASVERMATAIVLCHNHPSGSVKPSDEDISITKRIQEATKIMDIRLNDHLIIGNTKYYSFADEGII